MDYPSVPFIIYIYSARCQSRIDDNEKEEEEEEEKSENQGFHLQNLLTESSFLNFMRKVPRISSFIGHYSLILAKKYIINSVAEFYDHLFNPNLPQVLQKYQMGKADRKYLEMKEKTLKNVYEKFCFLNNYKENPLSSESNIEKPNQYSFYLEDDNDESLAFTHLMEKSEKDEIDPKTLENTDSLEVFFQNFCQITANDLDFLYSDDLEQEYQRFCDHYKVKSITNI